VCIFEARENLLSRPNKASADQQIALRSLIGDVKRAIAQLAGAKGRSLSIRGDEMLPLRFLHDRADAMKSGRAVRDLVAVFADLKFAFAIRSANYQFGFTFFVWRPLIAPETPAQLGSRFSNLSVIPSFAVIAADLHLRNSAVATESHPAQFDRFPNLERRFEMAAANLRRIEATVGWDRVALASPALLFVKPAAVTPVQSAIRFIQQLDPGKPLRILFAVEAGHDEA